MNRAAHRLRFIFLIVPIGFMLLLLVVPALQGVVLSFDVCGASLGNYKRIFNDPMFLRAFVNNLVIPIGSLILELAIGLLLALHLASGKRTNSMVEIAAILPYAIPEIVLLTIARYAFIDRGYVNGALVAAGSRQLPWLMPNRYLAFVSVVVVDAWHVTPVVMLILLAGIQAIPPEVYEAAWLDGATTLQTFRRITLPMIAPAVVAAVVLRGVDALRIFSTTLVLTGAEGVPVLSTYA